MHLDTVRKEHPCLDISGFWQFHTSWHAPYRDKICRWFMPVGEVMDQLRRALAAKVAEDETLIAVHLRRGADYGRNQFYITPPEQYVAWLKDLWPSIHKPRLYVASDDPGSCLDAFKEFNPLVASDLGMYL